MNRLLWIMAILALLSIGFAPVTARAFDIPGTGDGDSGMKKKKKKKNADDSSSDAGKTDSSKTDGSSTDTKSSDSSKSDSKTSGADTAKADGGAADGDNKQANIEAMIETCLAAYNADDVKTMAPNFASTMDANAYKNIYGPYKTKFGKYVAGSKKSVKIVTRFTPDNKAAHLGFNGEFEKQKKACIDCNVMNKNGKWMIVGLDFGDNGYNFPDDAGTTAGGTAAGQVYELKMPKSLWDTGTYMKELKAGDFIVTEMPAAAGMKSRTEVAEVGDHTVTFLQRTDMNGQVTEAKSKQIFSEPDPAVQPVKEENKKKVETKSFDDKIKIGSKGEFAAVRTETYEDGKLLSKIWICKDVPLGGNVRMEGPDGKVMMLVTDFGRGK